MSKRLFDLVLVILASPAWVPAVALLALVVRVVDGRPVFFFQERVGRGRRPFLIWKLRTMSCEPDPRDRRATRLGRWLRARGLDELPQVINMLLGSMSLVGPRPLSVADAERLVGDYPPFAERFRVPPGITGASQVGQVRGAALTAEVDLQYTRRRSLALDLALLMRTVWINLVGKSRGARPWQQLLGLKGAGSGGSAGERGGGLAGGAGGLGGAGGSAAVADAGGGGVVRETLRGLLAPRRLIPILLVSVPLVWAQGHLSRPSAAAWLGLAMCVAFVLAAPVSYRVLFPEGMGGAGLLVRLVLYVSIGAGVILTVGAVIPKLFHIPVTFMTARVSLAICLALFLVGGWGLGRDIGFEHSLARERSRAELLQREAERAQLLALRAQLDPHFLFNTLNCIAEWCREDGEVAERAVLQLSGMLRAVFEGVKLPSWPLGRELELVETLFALHRLRDPERFGAAIRRAPAAEAIAVPPMIVLPLAENAVKHGPAAGLRGEISLEARVEGETLVVEIENPGAYRGPRPGGSGLVNVERRLALAYGGKARLSIETVGGERTRARVVLPAGGPDPGVVT